MIYIVIIILLILLCGLSVYRNIKLSKDLEEQEKHIEEMISTIIDKLVKK